MRPNLPAFLLYMAQYLYPLKFRPTAEGNRESELTPHAFRLSPI